MRILILTQNENLYLPESFATVCRALGDDIVGIVSAPAMSTHGGPLKGFLRHLRLFGPGGTLTMGWRVISTRLRDRLGRPGPTGPFHSIRAVAAAFEIEYHYVAKLKGRDFLGLLDRLEPELLISISCPQIIGKKVRGRFPNGCINVHGAPLPRYRGLMPAFWALRFNERSTAATVHDLADKLDNGKILIQREVEILPEETWDGLVRKTKAAGAAALVDAVEQIRNGTVQRRPNLDEDATYYSFPTADDRKAFIKAGRRFFS